MLIRRNCPNEPNGKTVELGGIDYHFKPDGNGNNVCEVTEKAHVSRFLSLDGGESYEIHDGAGLKATAPKVTAPAPAAGGIDPFEQPTTVIVDDEPAPTDEDLERGRDDSADAELKAPKGPDYNGMTRKQLVAAYEKKFGRPPHPMAKDDTILAKLTA